MTAPAPHPGADNPFVLGYQTRQFPFTKDGNPDVTVADSLATPPSCTIDVEESSAVTARDATRYDPAAGATGA